MVWQIYYTIMYIGDQRKLFPHHPLPSANQKIEGETFKDCHHHLIFCMDLAALYLNVPYDLLSRLYLVRSRMYVKQLI